MLKFLDNRTHEKPAKSPKKYKPEMLYGISAESPQTFQTPYSIVHQQTYVNPYLEFEQERQSSLPKQKTININPSWKRKTNLQLVEEHKIISSEMEDLKKSPVSRYRQTYHQELNGSPNRFRITRGEFTNFIEKNNHYKSIGPLHGEQRTMDRIENTKKSVWLKPDLTCSQNLSKKNSMLYTTYFDMMRQSTTSKDCTMLRNQSCMSNNSKLITEKTRIRNNRDKMNSSFRNSLDKRKKSTPFAFQLPKLNSQLLGSLRPQKIRSTHQIDPMEQLKDLDQFQLKLKQKFK